MRKPLLFFLMFVVLGTALMAISAAPSASAEQQADRRYTITVIPYYSPEKIWVKFSPFVEYLKRDTGLPWELKLYHNHESLLAGLCGGEVSFALLGPVPMGRAVERCNARIAAVALGKDGDPFYRSVILTSDPSVRSLERLRGKRFGLFRGSTAAHIFPLKMLEVAGVMANDIVPVFFESQERIMNALLEREVAGAGVKENLYLKFKEDRLRILKTSDKLPGFALAVSPAADATAAKALVGSLLPLNPRKSPKHRHLMQDWDDEIKNGFIPPPPDFGASVKNALSVYNEIIHEDR